MKKILKNLDAYFAGFMFAITLCVVVVNVFTRYFANYIIPWGEEVATTCFVYTTFVGAAWCLRTHQHVGVDLLVDKLPAGAAEIRNGVDYGEMRSCTYWSSTRERETPVRVLLPAGYKTELITTKTDIPESVTAPINQGSVIGTVDVFYDGTKVGSAELCASANIDGATKSEQQAKADSDNLLRFVLIVVFIVATIIIVVIVILVVKKARRKKREVQRHRRRYY